MTEMCSPQVVTCTETSVFVTYNTTEEIYMAERLKMEKSISLKMRASVVMSDGYTSTSERQKDQRAVSRRPWMRITFLDHKNWLEVLCSHKKMLEGCLDTIFIRKNNEMPQMWRDVLYNPLLLL